MTPAWEVNFDGLVGPTHNYAGLSYGNIASQTHRHQHSNPRAAALEGLAKMKLLADMGVRQAVLPPHERPNLTFLRAVGFTGDDEMVIAKAAQEEPALLAAAYSASSMWTANAATVSPSADTDDGRVHFTPANLIGNLHRAIEAPFTAALLRSVFADPDRFVHHDPLPCAVQLGDEGAANHTRLCPRHGEMGIELFTWGRRALTNGQSPRRFPARQTYEASSAIARLHRLDTLTAVYVQQHPEAIDAGVFHNDVIAVGNESVLLCHERAFVDQRTFLEGLREHFLQCCNGNLQVIEVNNADVPLSDAVASYLFNSQLVTLPDRSMALIYPIECDEIPSTRMFLERLAEMNTPIRTFHSVNLRQSMRNGGGPACLRLRVVLTEEEWRHVHPGVIFNDDLYHRLTAWVEKHYREELAPVDLADPTLLRQTRDALDELTQILDLGYMYAFQR